MDHVQLHLFFDGRCEEAIDFYCRRLGAEKIMLARYGDSPKPLPPKMVPSGWESKVMHSRFRIGATMIFAADIAGSGAMGFAAGYCLSLNLTDEAKAEFSFAALAENGKIVQPMAATFFAKRFGKVVDGFGVPWMVHVS